MLSLSCALIKARPSEKLRTISMVPLVWFIVSVWSFWSGKLGFKHKIGKIASKPLAILFFRKKIDYLSWSTCLVVCCTETSALCDSTLLDEKYKEKTSKYRLLKSDEKMSSKHVMVLQWAQKSIFSYLLPWKTCSLGCNIYSFGSTLKQSGWNLMKRKQCCKMFP